MCTHTTTYVSSYDYVCVFIWLRKCLHTTSCVLILLYMSSYTRGGSRAREHGAGGGSHAVGVGGGVRGIEEGPEFKKVLEHIEQVHTRTR
jgi:hypothetical protein